MPCDIDIAEREIFLNFEAAHLVAGLLFEKAQPSDASSNKSAILNGALKISKTNLRPVVWYKRARKTTCILGQAPFPGKVFS